MKGVLTELDASGGRARTRELFSKAEPKLKLTAHEKERYEKSGYVRWESIVHFYSIDCLKAGYIQKAGGYWTLTDDGRAALKLGPADFIKSATEKYREWKRAQVVSQADGEEPEEQVEQAVRQTAYEEAKEKAQREIEEQISRLTPYEFQQLVAELLMAMGYFVTSVAKPGRDGGVDIYAYRDPLGTSAPRIKVQVKRRDEVFSSKEIRELQGLLRADGDIGLVVSSGGFSGEVERELRGSAKHVELMDLERVIELWQKHYDSIRESGKKLLPLTKLFFLAPPQE